MRVALSFPGCFRRGGVERVVLAMANGLSARGHEVHVFARTFELDQMDNRLTTHIIADCPSPRPAKRLKSFPEACQAKIAATGLSFDVKVGFGVACPPSDIAWVQSVHARWVKAAKGPAGGSRWQRFRRQLNSFHAAATGLEAERFGPPGPRAHRNLLALSPTVGTDLEEFYCVDPQRWQVLPNGVDPVAFNSSRASDMRASARERFQLRPNDRVIVFVANESVRKGLPTLLQAVARLEQPDVKILAAGRLPHREVQTEAKRLGIESSVRLCGPLDDVAEAFAAGDLFALPTHYEAWGLVIVEALACGLPVVVSAAAGAAVAIETGRTGLLLNDPSSVHELTVALDVALKGLPTTAVARSRSVEAYHWDNIVLSFEEHMIKAVS